MTNKDLNWVLSQDATFKYRLLSRMQSDCEYYLGYGNRCSKHLWAGNEVDHINFMKSIWNNLIRTGNPKPEWISFEQILDYQTRFGIEKTEDFYIICTDPRISMNGYHLGGKFPSYNDAISWAADNIPEDYEFQVQNDVAFNLIPPVEQIKPHPVCRDSDIVPTEPMVWICVYKDTLGFPDDFDNLTDICVPTDWLLNILKSEGETPKEWFSEYTADSTDHIAARAMQEGVIFGCADTSIEKEVISKSKNNALASMIHSAQTRASNQPQPTPEAKERE